VKILPAVLFNGSTKTCIFVASLVNLLGRVRAVNKYVPIRVGASELKEVERECFEIMISKRRLKL
jgi:hypothetical protein